ncbi:MAG TPA: hypothetical protein VK335_14880 [Bryobacteraceae bacterium]|nr:hypothetical protein [Bryobacteraceae bacterium]
MSRDHDARRALTDSGYSIVRAQGSPVLTPARASAFSSCGEDRRGSAAALLQVLQIHNHFLDLFAFLAKSRQYLANIHLASRFS